VGARAAMELWQMDVMGRVHLASGTEVKVVTGIDDHSRFIVSAKIVARATARPVCQALAEALARHGVPGQILTDNGKVFTGRLGRGPGPVMSGRICADNGIRHLLTAPYSPATTGKAERLHKTMRAEFFTPEDRLLATIGELQAALDSRVSEYNTARPHQSCGGRPPAGRFRLADRSITPGESAAVPAPAAPAARQAKRPAGVSRWVSANGKISLAGFSYHAGAAYAGEPVEVVAAGGLADILHAGVVVATHAQRLREDQAGRLPRATVQRRVRDATTGLTVTRLAGRHRGGQLRRHPVCLRADAGPPGHRRIDRRRLSAAAQRRQDHPRAPHPPRPDPRARRVRQPQRPPPPQELRRRPRRLTIMSPRYRNPYVAQEPELDNPGVRHVAPKTGTDRHLSRPHGQAWAIAGCQRRHRACHSVRYMV
jgi:hypothetical protein